MSGISFGHHQTHMSAELLTPSKPLFGPSRCFVNPRSFSSQRLVRHKRRFVSGADREVGVQAWEEEVLLSRMLLFLGVLLIPAAVGSASQKGGGSGWISFQRAGLKSLSA